MTPVPRKIYLQLNNVPPCDFGALWSEERVNDEDVAYVLETDHMIQDKLDHLQELTDLQHKVLCKRGAVVSELRKEIKALKEEIFKMSTDTDFLSNLYRRLERFEKAQDTKYLESLKPVTPEDMTRAEDVVKTQEKYIKFVEKDMDDLFKIMDQIADVNVVSDNLEKFCPFCFRTARPEASIDHDPYCLISQYRILRKKERLYVPDNQ